MGVGGWGRSDERQQLPTGAAEAQRRRQHLSSGRGLWGLGVWGLGVGGWRSDERQRLPAGAAEARQHLLRVWGLGFGV